MDTAEDSLKQMVRETYRWLMVPTEEMAARQAGAALGGGERCRPSAPSLVDEIENKLKEEEWMVYNVVTRAPEPHAGAVVLQRRQ
jgi:hypothetical protein